MTLLHTVKKTHVKDVRKIAVKFNELRKALNQTEREILDRMQWKGILWTPQVGDRVDFLKEKFATNADYASGYDYWLTGFGGIISIPFGDGKRRRREDEIVTIAGPSRYETEIPDGMWFGTRPNPDWVWHAEPPSSFQGDPAIKVSEELRIAILFKRFFVLDFESRYEASGWDAIRPLVDEYWPEANAD